MRLFELINENKIDLSNLKFERFQIPHKGAWWLVVALGGDKIGRIEIGHFEEEYPYVSWINVDEEYQRMGIGRLLYIEAAKWLKEYGRKLHASARQQDAAKSVWKTLPTGTRTDGPENPDSDMPGPTSTFLKLESDTR